MGVGGVGRWCGGQVCCGGGGGRYVARGGRYEGWAFVGTLGLGGRYVGGGSFWGVVGS